MPALALFPATTGGAYGADIYSSGNFGNGTGPAVPGSVQVLPGGLTPASGAIVVGATPVVPAVVVTETISLTTVVLGGAYGAGSYGAGSYGNGSSPAVPGTLSIAGTPALPQATVTAQAVAGSAAFSSVLSGAAATLAASAVTGTAATIVGITASPAASAIQAAAGQVAVSQTAGTSPATATTLAVSGAVRVSAVAALPPAAPVAQVAAGTATFSSALFGAIAAGTARAVAGTMTVSVAPPAVHVVVPAGSAFAASSVPPVLVSALAIAGSLTTSSHLAIREATTVAFAIAGQLHVSVFASSPPVMVRGARGVTFLGVAYGTGNYGAGDYGTAVNPAVPGAVRVSGSARLTVPVTAARAIAGQTSSSRKLTGPSARCHATMAGGHVKVSGTAAGTAPALHAVAVTGLVHAFEVVIIDPEPAMITASAPGGTVIARRDIVITGGLSPQPDIDIQLVVN